MKANMKHYQIHVGEREFTLNETEVAELDVVDQGNNQFHVLQDHQSYDIEVLHVEVEQKQVLLKVNGNTYSVQIQDELDVLVKQMGLSAKPSQKLQHVKAPMPGLILDVLVEEGQEVEPGSQLLILEAMKMENVLKAEGEGKVKSISIEKGNAVEKGQVLIEME